MTDNNNNLQTKEIFDDIPDQGVYGASVQLWNMWQTGSLIPPYWSYARDIALRQFAHDGDHISSAVNTMREMLTAIPKKVVPTDTTVKAHHRLADEYTDLLNNRFLSLVDPLTSDGLGMFLADFYTTDNGAFAAIEGPGKPDGPVMGVPTKIYHLDSTRCNRTGNSEYPVVYTHNTGKNYKLHSSRVINLTSQGNPSSWLYGVGFCAVSRAVYYSQTLKDIAIYKQEKLGSRPKRGIIVGDGIPVRSIEAALEMADMMMDDTGLTRYSRFPIIGSNKQGISLELVDLVSLPDGFNNIDEHQLAMHVLAFAFGVDVRQFGWAMGVSGQTKADAEIQHIKMQGKGPGWVIKHLTQQLNYKVMPSSGILKVVFDRQDDAQDEAQARVSSVRSQTRERDIKNGVITIRVAREQMVEDGEISSQQFEELELSEGRLPDGQPVITLFTNDKFSDLLDLGVIDPLNIFENDPAEMILEIQAAKADTMELIERGGSSAQVTRYRQAVAALDTLEQDYQAQIAEQVTQQVNEEAEQATTEEAVAE